jgi:hypothetical protein
MDELELLKKEMPGWWKSSSVSTELNARSFAELLALWMPMA